MAAKVLKFRRSDIKVDKGDMLEAVTIHRSADIASAAQALAQVVHDFELKAIVWPDLATMDPLIDDSLQPLATTVFGWEPEQVHRLYDYQLALSAPWVRASRVENEPFWISADGIFTRWQNRYLDEIDVGDFEQRALGPAAIVVPIHMPFGKIAAAAFVCAAGCRSDLSQEFACHADMLAGVTSRFLQDYLRTTRSDRYLPTEKVLPNRTVQCLQWAALGKTDYEIAIILGCSHAAIRYHITRACESLSAVNRVQAVFRAAQLGYLG